MRKLNLGDMRVPPGFVFHGIDEGPDVLEVESFLSAEQVEFRTTFC